MNFIDEKLHDFCRIFQSPSILEPYATLHSNYLCNQFRHSANKYELMRTNDQRCNVHGIIHKSHDSHERTVEY